MVKETKRDFVSLATVNGLLKAEKYGILDCILNHLSKQDITFRYVTNVNSENFSLIKFLLKKLDSLFSLKGKNPDFQDSIFPRMVIRDNEELLLFLNNPSKIDSQVLIGPALCTNCKSIIRTFYGVFEEIWNASSDIEERILELETGNSTAIMNLIKNPKNTEKRLFEALRKSKEEIFIVTSAERLAALAKNVNMIKNWCKKGISTKIMAPITTQNLNSIKKLLEFSEVRHIPVGYSELTIIDDQELFQFNTAYAAKIVDDSSKFLNLENVLYTTYVDYIKKTKKHLFELWEKTHFPNNDLRSINDSNFEELNPLLGFHALEKETEFMKDMKYLLEGFDEKEVLKKIEDEKKLCGKEFVGWSSVLRYFGPRAVALIPAIPSLSLPRMVICLFHHDEESTFGIENLMVINLWQKTPKGFSIVPVAFVQDNPNNSSFRKKVFKGFDIENNFIVLKPGQLHIQLKGNTLFAGWTKTIPLGNPELNLPPASLIFEGYGKVKPGMFTNFTPSGRRQDVYYNSFDAFVTFFHPKSKFIGSGIEGFVERENVFISSPSRVAKK